MKVTRNKTPPIVTPPDTFTLELSLDEMIFLKSVCKYYSTHSHRRFGRVALSAADVAANRFADLIPENLWSWSDTDKLFR